MKRLLLFVALAVCLAYGAPASAGPVGLPVVAPGSSWVVVWTDGNYSVTPFDKVEFFITAGGATFDAAADISGVAGVLVNPEYTVVTNPGGWTGNTVMTLSFSGIQTDYSGVQINVEYWAGTTLLTGTGFHWQWLNLPGNQSITEGDGWKYISGTPDYDRTVPDGGMTIMLLGMSLAGLGYARRFVK